MFGRSRDRQKGGYDSAIDWVEGDLLRRGSIDAAMKDCRYVFHVAGDYRFWARDPREIFANNVQHSLFFVHRCIPVVGGERRGVNDWLAGK